MKKHEEQQLQTFKGGEILLAAVSNISGVVENSKKTYLFQVRSYLKFCADRKKSVGVESVREWVEAAGTPKTAMTRLAAIKRVLRETFGETPQWKQLQDDLRDIKTPKVTHAKRRDQYLTSKEVETLCDGMPPKMSIMARALFETGIRVSEFSRIKIKDCELFTNPDNKKKSWIILHNIIGKGGVEINAYMSVKTFNECLRLWEGKVYLFEKNGEKLTRFYITKQIRTYAKKVLNRDISAHNLRHSKAMYLVDELKLSIYEVQRALNHRKPSTTIENYFHGVPDADRQGLV